MSWTSYSKSGWRHINVFFMKLSLCIPFAICFTLRTKAFNFIIRVVTSYVTCSITILLLSSPKFGTLLLSFIFPTKNLVDWSLLSRVFNVWNFFIIMSFSPPTNNLVYPCYSGFIFFFIPLFLGLQLLFAVSHHHVQLEFCSFFLFIWF